MLHSRQILRDQQPCPYEEQFVQDVLLKDLTLKLAFSLSQVLFTDKVVFLAIQLIPLTIN